MNMDTLKRLYRDASDTAQTVAAMAEHGDRDAIELLEYVQWASHALSRKLAHRLQAHTARLRASEK